MTASELAQRIPLRQESDIESNVASDADSGHPDAIREGSKLTLHFAVLIDDDTVVDSNFEKEPVSFVIGDGNMLPGFEQQLRGKQAGDRIEVWVKSQQAFGLVNPDNQQRVPRYQFPPDLALSENLLIEFADVSGYSQAGRVVSIGKQYVEIDFNHPLAGKEILFKALIIKVEQNT